MSALGYTYAGLTIIRALLAKPGLAVGASRAGANAGSLVLVVASSTARAGGRRGAGGTRRVTQVEKESHFSNREVLVSVGLIQICVGVNSQGAQGVREVVFQRQIYRLVEPKGFTTGAGCYPNIGHV